MPAKAISTKIGPKTPTDFSALTLPERVSLRKFSIFFVILQAFPLLLIAVFALIAGIKYGYFSTRIALLGLLAVLAMLYVAMPPLTNGVIDGIMALRKVKAAKT